MNESVAITPANPPIRIVARLLGQLMLDLGADWTVALEQDRLGALCLTIVLLAGLPHQSYREHATGQWLGLDAELDRRRPVAVRAVAASLGLSYETVRRRFVALADAGLVRIDKDGVRLVVPFGTTPGQRALIERDAAAFGATISALATAGYPAADEALSACRRLPAAVIARIVGDMSLRHIEPTVGMYGDILNGVIVAAIIVANVRHIAADPILSRRYAGHDTPPPDALRRPVGVRELARLTILPAETVRRRAARLVESGEAYWRNGGLVVGAERLLRPVHRETNLLSMRYLDAALATLVALAGTGLAGLAGE